MAASAPDDAVDFPYTRHSAPSAIAMRQLEETYHLPAAVQQRIGALIVYCNFIETLAEKVLWVLRQEDVRDQVPSTSQYKARSEEQTSELKSDVCSYDLALY